MSEIGAIELDDDLIARSIQGFAPPVIETPKFPTPNFGFSSTIAPVAPQFAPILVPPKQNIMIRALEAQGTTEELAQRRIKNFEIDSTKAMAKIERLSMEGEQAFLKEMEAAKNRDSWSTLSIIFQYVTSISSITIGMSLVGGVPGLLIALGGIAGGTVRLLNDTNLIQPIIAWFTKSDELQKSIKQNIDIGAMGLQLGLGLAGGAAAWQAGTFAAMQAANTVEYLRQAASMLTTASSVMGAGGQVGAAYYSYHAADWNATERMADLGVFEQRQELTHQIKNMDENFDTDRSIYEQMKKMIKNQEVQLD